MQTLAKLQIPIPQVLVVGAADFFLAFRFVGFCRLQLNHLCHGDELQSVSEYVDVAG